MLKNYFALSRRSPPAAVGDVTPRRDVTIGRVLHRILERITPCSGSNLSPIVKSVFNQLELVLCPDGAIGHTRKPEYGALVELLKVMECGRLYCGKKLLYFKPL